jgi:hypothetical protein
MSPEINLSRFLGNDNYFSPAWGGLIVAGGFPRFGNSRHGRHSIAEPMEDTARRTEEFTEFPALHCVLGFAT